MNSATTMSSGHNNYVGNNGVNDYDCELIGITEVCTQSFLWIYQEKYIETVWQYYHTY